MVNGGGMLVRGGRVLAAGGLVVASMALASAGAAAAAPAETAAARFKFSYPDAVASGSRHVWITDEENNSVTELNAATGKLERVIT